MDIDLLHVSTILFLLLLLSIADFPYWLFRHFVKSDGLKGLGLTISASEKRRFLSRGVYPPWLNLTCLVFRSLVAVCILGGVYFLSLIKVSA